MNEYAYIIKNNKVMAKVKTYRASGSIVHFSCTAIESDRDASRALELVNAQMGVISRAEKWRKKEPIQGYDLGDEINTGEFQIV